MTYSDQYVSIVLNFSLVFMMAGFQYLTELEKLRDIIPSFIRQVSTKGFGGDGKCHFFACLNT